MIPQLACRILRSTSPRILWKLAWNAGFRGMLSIEKFKRRVARGEYFPPFLHFSITNSCNLRCDGCWADVDKPQELIDAATLNRTIEDARRHGNSIFGLLGGEPLLHPQLMDVIAAHPGCYFQVFSNGQLITEKVAEGFHRAGNVTPLISIEGLESVSDQRRGKPDVFRRSMRGLENCVRAKLFTGVATSLCKSNVDELLTETWLRRLIDLGVHYIWYYTYRPVGPKPNYELALEAEQLLQVRKFIVEMRSKLPIIIIETYYDDRGQSLCPMATGLSHHISPRGEIEPCPIIQFAADNIRDPRGIFETMRSSDFLREFRSTAASAMRGCIVLERPDLIRALVEKHRAHDSTIRGTALAEVDATEARFSQWLPGYEVPEKHWAYRLTKRFWFNSFGAYNGAPHDVARRQRELKNRLDRTAPAGDSLTHASS